MYQRNKVVKDIILFTIFVLSLTAVFWLQSIAYQFFISIALLFVIAIASRNRREVWPILLIVCLLISIQAVIGRSITDAIALFLTVSFIDLLIAYSIVSFHRDGFLLKICRVGKSPRQIPQVYFISFVLAVSSLFSFLLGTEMIFYTFEPDIFAGSEPFFYSIYFPVKVTIKILFDLCIWSLILDPSRWKLLRKIEQKFDS